MAQALIIFAVMFALDWVWTYYTHAVKDHRALAAGCWALMIAVFNGLLVLGYVLDWTLLIPAAVGAFTGTYCSVRWRAQ